MRPLTRPLAATVLTATCLLSVPAANAQTQSPQAQSPQAQSPSPGASEQAQNIPDEKLNAAAAAMEQVSSVKENYQGRMEAAAPSDRPRIAAEAKNALEGAVTGQGLSVDEYNSILTVAQNNPDVREKILQRVRPPAK
jgi:predicted ATPase with chaperone activity